MRFHGRRRVVHGPEQVGHSHALARTFAAREHEHVLHEQIEVPQPVDALLEQRGSLCLVAPRTALRQIQQRAGERRTDLVREARGHLADRRQPLIAAHELLERARLGDVGEQNDARRIAAAAGSSRATLGDPHASASRRRPTADAPALRGRRFAMGFRRDPTPSNSSAPRLYSWIRPASSTTITPAGSVPSSERSRSAVRSASCAGALARAARVLELGRQRRSALLQHLIRALQLRRKLVEDAERLLELAERGAIRLPNC